MMEAGIGQLRAALKRERDGGQLTAAPLTEGK
jgi:hypothetical protein